MKTTNRISKLLVAVSVAFLLVLSAASITPAFAQDDEKPWAISVATGIYTDYVFRGKTVYEGTSIQPSVTAMYDFGDYGSLSANIWSQLPGETNEPPEKFAEVDYTLSYDFTYDILTVGVGHIWYTFPDYKDVYLETEEFFITASLDTILNPSFTFYNSYSEGEYQYYTVTVSETLPLPFLGDDVEITPYSSFAFASNADDDILFYFEDGLEHIDVGASMYFELGMLYVSPNFNFSFAIDDGANDEFWMGVDIGFDI